MDNRKKDLKDLKWFKKKLKEINNKMKNLPHDADDFDEALLFQKKLIAISYINFLEKELGISDKK